MVQSVKPAIVKGWDIPREDYLKAHEEGGLVKLSIDLSNVCNLSCSGCFTKRVGDSWNGGSKHRLPNEISYEDQIALLEEASKLGTKSVDIVGAGEPTLDLNYKGIIKKIHDLGMHPIVFTHGATPYFNQLENFADKNISFFLKFWSQNPSLQNKYVQGSLRDYSKRRDRTLERLFSAGLNEGSNITLDGIDYNTTQVGADILVMRSNFDEIVDLFSFCRENNTMPLIKTYIPEGPTRFDQEANLGVYSPEQLLRLREDEIGPNKFLELREELAKLDKTENGVPLISVFYPQATKCTQSMASLYVTATGDIRSCVGTHVSYGTYEPNKGMLLDALKKRKERVGFGCVPRIDDAKERGIPLDPKLAKLYDEGTR